MPLGLLYDGAGHDNQGPYSQSVQLRSVDSQGSAPRCYEVVRGTI